MGRSSLVCQNKKSDYILKKRSGTLFYKNYFQMEKYAYILNKGVTEMYITWCNDEKSVQEK